MSIPQQRLGEDFTDQHALDVWQVVQQVQAGDTGAFGLLYERYHAQVFRFVYSRTRQRELCEDLTADTFVKALHSIGGFRWQGRDFGAWLTTIARNLIADYFKSGRARKEFANDDFVLVARGDDRPWTRPEDTVCDAATAAIVNDALARLSPSHQAILRKRFFEGQPILEAAAELGLEAGALKTLQYRAIGALARQIPDGVDERGAPPPAVLQRSIRRKP